MTRAIEKSKGIDLADVVGALKRSALSEAQLLMRSEADIEPTAKRSQLRAPLRLGRRFLHR